MSYISGLKVVYGSSQGAVDGEDINKGFSGTYMNIPPLQCTSMLTYLCQIFRRARLSRPDVHRLAGQGCLWFLYRNNLQRGHGCELSFKG